LAKKSPAGFEHFSAGVAEFFGEIYTAKLSCLRDSNNLELFGLFIGHYLQDKSVGFSHAVTTYFGEVGYCAVDVIVDNAFQG
jgi:hypothetical protein